MESAMSVNLSIKGVPEEWAERLRARAERNHRSLQGELMALIERAAGEDEANPQSAAPSPSAPVVQRGEVIVRRGTKTIEQIGAELRAIYPPGMTDLPRSVDLVREMRDSR